MRIILVGDEEYLITEQITKADRNACHALCGIRKVRVTLGRLSSTVPCTKVQYFIVEVYVIK